MSLIGHAIELEYISPKKKAELELQFEKADFSSKDQALVKQKKWTCDMYGVRTRLQVKRGMKLYRWQEGAPWHNEGVQVVRDYQAQKNQLLGQNDRFEDSLKINSKGQLISRLSALRPERQVVAYSVCDAL